MEHGFSILLICFSGALFLYAGIVAPTKKIILPYRYQHTLKNTGPRYAVQFAKIMAIVACSPLIAGGIGYFAGSAVAGILLLVTMIAAIVLATKIIKKADD